MLSDLYSREPPWASIRWRPPAGTLPIAVFVLLLVLCLGNSTVAANWVPGSDGLTNLALVAALLMGALALARRLPWSFALAVGGVRRGARDHGQGPPPRPGRSAPAPRGLGRPDRQRGRGQRHHLLPLPALSAVLGGGRLAGL